jgi:uncharacterized protein
VRHVGNLGEPPSVSDEAVISHQLGREARDIVGITARCVCGNPVVVSTKPRLSDGTPFPTLYYLTQTAATQAASRLEAAGLMSEYQDRLVDNEELQAAYQAAHESYLVTRESIEFVEEIAGISAGGMPDRVKCLHALMAHSLSVGVGINPVGDFALADTPWSTETCHC